jgi:4a-hydroxytetrahydrobiopterin dehydratase
MSQTTKLSGDDRQAALADLEGWHEVEGRDAIARTFTFGNFNLAFAFMTRVAMLAEKMGHHPEWSNVYNRVDVVLATHTVSGVTELDVKMAEAMNRFAGLGAK